jgi:polyisoprenoid-binding protein YceI
MGVHTWAAVVLAGSIGVCAGSTRIWAAPQEADAGGAAVRLEVAPGTRATYRVREQLLGFELPNDAVGTTEAVSGTFVLEPDGAFRRDESILTVDLRTLESDERRRDEYLRDRTLRTDRFPLAEFVPRRIEGLAMPLPSSGDATFRLIGDLTMHGVTAVVSWAVDATFRADRVTGSASTNFLFSTFDLPIPRLPGLVSVTDDIRLELDVALRPAPLETD